MNKQETVKAFGKPEDVIKNEKEWWIPRDSLPNYIEKNKHIFFG